MNDSPEQKKQPDDSHQEQAPANTENMGRGMLYMMWVIILGGLSFAGSQWEAKKHNPNQSPNGQTTSSTITVELKRNAYGHYVTTGTINQQKVIFFLDTGATNVSVPADIARKLKLKAGPKVTHNTANGTIDVAITRIPELAIGDIKLYDVPASINPYMEGDDILLGMSVLKHMDFSQQGDTLTLTQYRY